MMTSTLNYKIGDKVRARITNILPFCILVELEDKRVGIIHNRELSWNDREVNYPKKYFQKDQLIDAIINEIDAEGHRILLSRRLAERDPWQTIHDKYQVNQFVKAIVTGVTRTNIFSEIEKGVQAVCPLAILKMNSEAGTNASESLVFAGDTVIGKIVSINSENRSIRIEIYGYFNEISKADLEAIFRLRGIDIRESIPPANNIFDNAELTPIENDSNLTKHEDSALAEWRKEINHILVIDDDENLSDSMKEVLVNLGYNAHNAYTANAALELLDKEDYDFDLVLIDLTISDMDGVILAKKISAKFPEILMILITGKPVSQLSSNLEDLPASCLLLKPFNSRQVEEAIHEVITRENHLRSEHIIVGMEAALEADDYEPISYEHERRYSERNVYEEKIKKILNRLVKDTSASAGAIFSLHPVTFQTRLIAGFGIDKNEFFRVQYRLRYSPVKDVIFENETLRDAEVEAKKTKYRNLLKLIHFKSCIALKLEAGGEEGYGLFLFDPQIRDLHYLEHHFLRARLAASKIESLLREKKFAEWSEKDQRFMLDGQLLTGLAHELNTKLTTMQLQTELLNSLLKTESVAPDMMIQIRQKANTINLIHQEMTQISKYLLRFSKTESQESVDVNKCLEGVLSSLKPLAKEARIKLDCDFDPELPTAHGMQIKMEQVFLNILLNAIQNINCFIKTAGQIIVRTKCNSQNSFPIRIEFIDTGTGIHRKNFLKIFEPFYTTRPEGHGMGLAISKGIMDAIGGKIYVQESILFIGSIFVVEFAE